MNAMTRRQFLSRSAMATAAVVASTALTRAAWANPLGLPLGIQLYVVGADMQKDAPGTVKQIAQIGYKEVETAGFGSMKSAAELRKVLDDNGLKCPSAHLNFKMENLNAAFDDGHALGVTYVTSSVPQMMLSGMDRTSFLKPLTPDQFKNLADTMNTVGAAAKKAGLKFAAHNHTMEFAMDGTKPGYDYLISHTDASLVSFEIDCGWMTVAGYKPADYVQEYPGRIKMLHIKDFLPYPKGASTGGPDRPNGAEIGQGVVDYKQIFAGVKGGHIEHVFVEQEGPYSRMPALQAAAVDYKYLSTLS